MNPFSSFAGTRKACFVPGISLLLLLPAFLAAHAQNSAEKAFVSGGRIEIQLESGGYEVKPSADNKIRVSCSGEQSGQVRVAVNTNGTHADVKVSNTPHNH